MTETLHWYAETTGGVRQGDAPVYPGCGALHLSADLPAGTLKAVRAELPWKMETDERLFMNGYQTWTYSPELGRSGKLRGVDHIPAFLCKNMPLTATAITICALWASQGAEPRLFLLLFPQGRTVPAGGIAGRDPGLHHLPVRQPRRPADAGAGLHRGGASRRQLSPVRPVFAEGSEAEVFDGWFQAMGIKPRTEKKLAGYSSWYNRYQDITKDTIREDLTGCRGLLCPGDLFQIDDGWEPKVGDWLDTDAQKFPHGLKGMVDEIHAAGFQAGLWLAPFVCEKDSALFRQHPDWLLKVDGAPWCCGCNWSGFYALDIDNPAVLDYLRRVFDRVLNDWGFDLVKLDFLYGASPFGNAHESRAARMRRAMELLRSWCGQKAILGCGVPVMPAFGLVDYCRVSCDVSLDWDDVWYMRLFHRERVSTKQALNNTVFRRQLNGRAYGSDPDVFFLREENCKLTAEQNAPLPRSTPCWAMCSSLRICRPATRMRSRQSIAACAPSSSTPNRCRRKWKTTGSASGICWTERPKSYVSAGNKNTAT